ncbi:polysaccharide biosynthesis protein [Clostridiales bacterium COT073_COT-073]|nr:polysaccharide biosynthesis protein [Clostridiales bacterium COT073_COT-073]
MFESWKTMDKKLLIRRAFLILLDIILINFAAWCALIVRFDFSLGNIPVHYSEAVSQYALINTAITLVLFWIFRLYHSLWKYAGIEELTNVAYACVISAGLQFMGMTALAIHVPRSFFPLYLAFLGFSVASSRFAYRFLRMINNRYRSNRKKRTMIIGAGEAANAIIKEINNSQYLDGKIVCAIDDNRGKVGSYIQGIKVVGTRDDIIEMVAKYEVTDIIIAIPSYSKKHLKPILDICKQTDCSLRILPGMYQLINGQVSASQLRNVDIEDLIGRDTVNLDLKSIMNYVSGKVVMVTGGGGSIGSELCRQLAKYQPKELIIVDFYENNAYEIQQELQAKYKELVLTVLIASVCDKKRMDFIFSQYRPEIIYHAAAHKHVPLMEESPNEAIKNNVFGTWNMTELADKYGVQRFVQISTDKAVNPTNIMGASKRICEMIIQSYDKKSKTEFVAVRFGNVLASNGSVVPLFRKQILRGGPVTVTHPEVIRYFMTIPEATALVLQAGALAEGGEIFVLDMGEPVKIVDLARNLIRLMGYIPDRDIQIEFIGLRPGEKLYEELLLAEEGMKATSNQLIHIGKPIQMEEKRFYENMDRLKTAIAEESHEVKEIVKELVPTYRQG